jgi:hypothetical protein
MTGAVPLRATSVGVPDTVDGFDVDHLAHCLTVLSQVFPRVGEGLRHENGWELSGREVHPLLGAFDQAIVLRPRVRPALERRASTGSGCDAPIFEYTR